MPQRVLYLSYNSVLTQGILRSQVVVLVKHLARRGGLRITLVSGERLRDWLRRDEKRKLRAELGRAGVEIRFVPKMLPRYLRVERSLLGRLLSAPALVADLVVFTAAAFWAVLACRISVVHARSYIPGLISLVMKRLLGVRLVFDPRGIIPEELRLARGWSEHDWRYLWWKRAERRLLRGADAVFALSRPFADHLRAIHDREYLVTPCCVDTDTFKPNGSRRRATRERLGLKDDDILVVFSVGCFVPYQEISGAVALFDQLRCQGPEQRIRLLILSPDKDAIRRYLVGRGRSLDDIIFESAPYDEMPGWLAGADVGLLVRVPSPVSRVASPVKLAEYLACGLAVLAFKDIGETDALLARHRVGVSVSPRDPEDQRRGVAELLRLVHDPDLPARCTRAAREELDWERYLPLYFRAYGLSGAAEA